MDEPINYAKIGLYFFFFLIFVVALTGDVYPEVARIAAYIAITLFIIGLLSMQPSKEQIEADNNAKIAAERAKYKTCRYCGYRWKMRYPHTRSNPPSKCPNCNRKIR